jgi:GNAT superfamily N-acetyltransferase
MRQMEWLRRWYGLLKFLNWFPNPLQYKFCAYVAEQGRMLLGMIQVSPFNRTHSTWRVDRVMLERGADKQAIGSQLLRYCFESIVEARTWILEVNVNDKDALALYRKNGFQRLAEMTYWEIEPELLQELAQSEPDLPNLLPVSNADAQLLYQLDTSSMPPLVRQVFDRNADDFKTSLFGVLTQAVKQWVTKTEVVSGYVFEPQRKAAIGYFQVRLDRKGQQPHMGTLTVNPAYTWLYPELLSQLARVAQDFPPQALQLTSADYHPEREEYLERIGANRREHTLMMSRSVWHKLRESKFVSLEGIQLPEVLQGLQPARKPIPGGMSWAQGQQVSPDRGSQPSKNTETVAFSCNNCSVEASSQPESADAQQE